MERSVSQHKSTLPIALSKFAINNPNALEILNKNKTIHEKIRKRVQELEKNSKNLSGEELINRIINIIEEEIGKLESGVGESKSGIRKLSGRSNEIPIRNVDERKRKKEINFEKIEAENSALKMFSLLMTVAAAPNRFKDNTAVDRFKLDLYNTAASKKQVENILEALFKKGVWPTQLKEQKRLINYVSENLDTLKKVIYYGSDISSEDYLIERIFEICYANVGISDALKNGSNVTSREMILGNIRIAKNLINNQEKRDLYNYVLEKRYGSVEYLKHWFGIKGEGMDAVGVLNKVLDIISKDKGFIDWRINFTKRYGEDSRDFLDTLDILGQYSFYKKLLPILKSCSVVNVLREQNKETGRYEYRFENITEIDWVRKFARKEFFGNLKLESTKLELINNFYPSTFTKLQDLRMIEDVMQATVVAEVKNISYYPWDAEKRVVAHLQKSMYYMEESLFLMLDNLYSMIYQNYGINTKAPFVSKMPRKLSDKEMDPLSPIDQLYKNIGMRGNIYPSVMEMWPQDMRFFRNTPRYFDLYSSNIPKPNPEQLLKVDKDMTRIVGTSTYVDINPLKVASSSLIATILNVDPPDIFDKTVFTNLKGSAYGYIESEGSQESGNVYLNMGLSGIGDINATIRTNLHETYLTAIFNDISTGENWKFDGSLIAIDDRYLHGKLDTLINSNGGEGKANNLILFFDKRELNNQQVYYACRGYYRMGDNWYRIQYDKIDPEEAEKILLAMSGNRQDMRLLWDKQHGFRGGLVAMSLGEDIGAFIAAGEKTNVIGALLKNVNNYYYGEVYFPQSESIVKKIEEDNKSRKLEWGSKLGAYGESKTKDWWWTEVAAQKYKDSENILGWASFAMKKENISLNSHLFQLEKLGKKGTEMGGTFGGYLTNDEWKAMVACTIAKETLGFNGVQMKVKVGREGETQHELGTLWYSIGDDFVRTIQLVNSKNAQIMDELKKLSSETKVLEIGKIQGNIEQYLYLRDMLIRSFAFSQMLYGLSYAINKRGLRKAQIEGMFGKDGYIGSLFTEFDSGLAFSTGVVDFERLTPKEKRALNSAGIHVVVPISASTLGVMAQRIKESDKNIGRDNLTDSIYAALKVGNVTYFAGGQQTKISEKEANEIKNGKIQITEAGIKIFNPKTNKEWYLGISKQGLVLVDNTTSKIDDQLWQIHGGIYTINVENNRLTLTDIRAYLGGGLLKRGSENYKQYVVGLDLEWKRELERVILLLKAHRIEDAVRLFINLGLNRVL